MRCIPDVFVSRRAPEAHCLVSTPYANTNEWKGNSRRCLHGRGPRVERLDYRDENSSQRKIDKDIEACEHCLEYPMRSDLGTSCAEESLAEDDINKVEDKSAGVREHDGYNA